MHPDVSLLDLAEMHRDLGIEEDLRVAMETVLASGRYVLGPALERFEEEFATYCGAKHCIGVGSGFDALALGLLALGIGPGDEVLVPSHTFIATWMAVSSVGAVPVPVPPEDPESSNLADAYLLSAQACERVISPNTAAILPVHLYGHPVEMASLMELADRHQLFVLEDAAQSHGATIAGKRACWGDAAAYSFYPGKNLGALGDGGAVVTDDDSTASLIRELRNYGGQRKNQHLRLGRNSRLDEVQSAVLSVKLGHLDEWNARRGQIANRYESALSGIELLTSARAADWARPVWHQYPVRSSYRATFTAGLSHRGIETGRHYEQAIQDTAAYARCSREALRDEADQLLARRSFSLPIGPHLSNEEVDRVIEAIANVAAQIQAVTK